MTEVQQPSISEPDQIGKVECATAKPWYISSVVIYQTVKGAILSLPYCEASFKISVESIEAFSRFIEEKTQSNILVIESGQINALIGDLDILLSELFIVLDDGFDALRGKLLIATKNLIAVLVIHKELVINRAHGTYSSLRSRYEYALDVAKNLLEVAKSSYPNMYDSASRHSAAVFHSVEIKAATLVDSVHRSTQSLAGRSNFLVDSNSFLATASKRFLVSAQPYVQSIVASSTPYISTAVEVSQPYVVHARPFLDPLVLRAQEANIALHDNALVGPYVSKALQAASLVLDEAKSYCLNSSVAEAVSTDEPGLVSADEDLFTKHVDVNHDADEHADELKVCDHDIHL
jgi:hypothetical protein